MKLFMLLVLIYTSRSTDAICQDASTSGGTTHFPHPTNCAKFVVCNWGQPTVHDCPAGTLWNDFVKTCDHARNVKCRRPLVHNTAVVVGNHRNPNCPRVIDLHRPVYVPHHDCTKFYLCTAAGPREMACDSGYNWNKNTKRCEWPGSTGVIPTSFVRTPPPPPAPVLTTTKPSTTTPEMPRSGCPTTIAPNKPVYLPHPDCSMFYMCTSKGPKELHCISGYHWSVSTNSCEFPWDAGCIDINASPSSSTTTAAASTHQTPTQAPPNESCPDKLAPNSPVFLPHPDQTKIYICISGVGRMELSCPKGLRWNEKGVCIPMEGTSTTTSPPLRSTTPMVVNRRTTTASGRTVNATEESTEPNEAFGTDVPIFG